MNFIITQKGKDFVEKFDAGGYGDDPIFGYVGRVLKSVYLDELGLEEMIGVTGIDYDSLKKIAIYLVDRGYLLRKPDTNKPVFKIFPESRESVKLGVCPFCGKDIKAENFMDDLSRKEYSISGMCQACQDRIFKPGNEE
jgi:predicted transcriptional regulator